MTKERYTSINAPQRISKEVFAREYVAEPVETAILRLYDTGDRPWKKVVNEWNGLHILPAAVQTTIGNSWGRTNPEYFKKGAHVVAGKFVGSGGRRWIQDEPHTFKTAQTLREALVTASAEPAYGKMDPLYRSAYEQMNPYDADYRMLWDGTPEEFLHAMRTSVSKWTSIATYSIREDGSRTIWRVGLGNPELKYHATCEQFVLDNGTPVVTLTLRPPHDPKRSKAPLYPFTIDLLLPTPPEHIHTDFRSGPHTGSKGELGPSIFVVREDEDEDELDQYYFAMHQTDHDQASEALGNKTNIEKVEFISLEQALVVAARMTNAELSNCTEEYSTIPNTLLDEQTTYRFREELDRLKHEFTSSDAPVDEYRVQEFIQNTAVAFTNDYLRTLSLYRELGVLDLFIGEFLSAKANDHAEGMPHLMENIAVLTSVHSHEANPIAFVKTLRLLGYHSDQETDWGTFAEMFDIRRLQDV